MGSDLDLDLELFISGLIRIFPIVIIMIACFFILCAHTSPTSFYYHGHMAVTIGVRFKILASVIHFNLLWSVYQVCQPNSWWHVYEHVLYYNCLSLWQLTAKNIQCMRTLLNLAHCHGAVLGTSWQLVLATLQVLLSPHVNAHIFISLDKANYSRYSIFFLPHTHTCRHPHLIRKNDIYTWLSVRKEKTWIALLLFVLNYFVCMLCWEQTRADLDFKFSHLHFFSLRVNHLNYLPIFQCTFHDLVSWCRCSFSTFQLFSTLSAFSVDPGTEAGGGRCPEAWTCCGGTQYGEFVWKLRAARALYCVFLTSLLAMS